MPRNNRRVLNQDSLETITDLAEGLCFLLAFLARGHLKSRLNFPNELGTHFCLLLSCPIEIFCKNTTFFSIDKKIWHFFYQNITILQRSLSARRASDMSSGAALLFPCLLRVHNGFMPRVRF